MNFLELSELDWQGVTAQNFQLQDLSLGRLIHAVSAIYTCIALQNFNHRPDTGLLHATEGNPIHCTKTTGGCIAVVYAKHSPTLWVTATCLVVRVVFLDNCLKLRLLIEAKR